MATRKKTEADSKGKLKFNSPLDMREHKVNKAPESAMQAPEEDVDGRWRGMMESGTTEAEYQEPVAPVDDWRDGFEREYGWLAPNNVAGVYRAILQELYRLRVGK